jgi:hypothetical protein
LFDLPKLDPAEVAGLFALEPVATMWYRGATLGGLGPPRPATLEFRGDQVTLYGPSKVEVFEAPAAAVAVEGAGEVLRLRVGGARYRLRACDLTAVRHRGKPAAFIEYMEYFHIMDRVPGFGSGNEVFGTKATAARKGMWVGLCRSLLVRRGASPL